MVSEWCVKTTWNAGRYIVIDTVMALMKQFSACRPLLQWLHQEGGPMRDASVSMFNVYVYGSVRKVRSRFRACSRGIVIFTSLKNNLMLAEIT